MGNPTSVVQTGHAAGMRPSHRASGGRLGLPHLAGARHGTRTENKPTRRMQPMKIRNNEETLVYVGTYTRGESKGIYTYGLDASSGALTLVGTGPYVESPSFLASDPKQ
ncbi:MAG: beta-propeller fold lactonase family protein, partial [Candidatus Latescibacteria bacterium]|nr:beta-propeller fold lactonase family protein [Candidatus Latescibacterota bacterium]